MNSIEKIENSALKLFNKIINDFDENLDNKMTILKAIFELYGQFINIQLNLNLSVQFNLYEKNIEKIICKIYPYFSNLIITINPKLFFISFNTENKYKEFTIYENIEFIDCEIINEMLIAGAVIDARNGGLLIAPAHSNGGIKAVQKFNNNYYKVVAEVEGWEYIISSENTNKHRQILNIINDIPKMNWKIKYDSFIPYNYNNLHIINTPKYDSETPLLLLNDNQYIINRVSSKMYSKELEIINSKNTFYKNMFIKVLKLKYMNYKFNPPNPSSQPLITR